MTFLALDSNRHYHTAKIFGINLNHYRDKTAVLIYDMKVKNLHNTFKTYITSKIR